LQKILRKDFFVVEKEAPGVVGGFNVQIQSGCKTGSKTIIKALPHTRNQENHPVFFPAETGLLGQSAGLSVIKA